MRGKFGLVLGLGIGYVLGTRAGRERYEQIKTQALKVWNLDPVQKQVEKAKDAGRSAALALPRAAWNGAVKVARSVTPSPEPAPEPASSKPEAPRKPAGSAAKPSPKTAAAKKPAGKAATGAKEPTDRTPAEALERAREMIDEAEGPAANQRSTGEG